MKRADILSRIIELVRQKGVNDKLDLLSYNYINDKIERSIFIRGGKLYYCSKIEAINYCTTYHEKKISKFKLAAILYEIGDENDRSSVVNDITFQDYAYINNKLGIPFKTK